MKRCSATSLANNGASENEIADAIDDELRGVLDPALRSVVADLEPAEFNALFAHITAFVGLVGQNWTAAGRGEFIDLAVNELERLPGGLVLDALARARRRLTDGRLLISWVCDDVEPRAAKLEAECLMLTRLIGIAG